MRMCAISVDLDEIPNYFAIHGLPAPSGEVARKVYEVALGRLTRFAAEARVPLTLFAIGKDLESSPLAAAALGSAARAGHEIANHSLNHLYDLTRQPRAEIVRQIAGGAEVIARTTGVRPTGFRAPGYTITDEVFSVLRELGVAYDSSVFPCPAYWAAKRAAITAISLRGRRSRSVVDTPSVLLAPVRPYRVGAPYWKRARPTPRLPATGSTSESSTEAELVELPIQVTRGLRLPFIGTTVTLAGPSRARLLTRMCVGEPLVNLELHGIDVLDASDGLEALRPHQPDVRVPYAVKLNALAVVVETLRAADYTFVTCSEAARAF